MELTRPSFTVLVADGGEDGATLRQLAQDWFADGLLGEFAWVSPADTVPAATGPVVSATVLGRQQPVELLQLLSARPHALIRLVALQVLRHDRATSRLLGQACEQIAELVQTAMPHRAGGPGDDALRLLRVNLLVPESSLTGQSADLVRPGWQVNAVVSPEDRVEVDRLDVRVRAEANLHAHALAAAAAVGGLWTGCPTGALDEHAGEFSAGADEVRVLRCQARMVVADHRNHQLAARVAVAVQQPDQVPEHLTWAVPAQDPQAMVDSALRQLLDHPDWQPVPRDPRPLPEEQVLLLRLLADWARFQVWLPVAAVLHLLGLGMRAVERSITAATVGRKAGVQGRFRPLTPRQAQVVAECLLAETAARHDPAQLHDDAATWGQPTPTAWSDLRRLVIGLVDGSALPSRMHRGDHGGREEVLAPAAVVPGPDTTLTLPARGVLSILDVEGTAELARQLQQPPAGEDTEQARQQARAATAQLEQWVRHRRHTLLWRLAAQVAEHRRREHDQAQHAHQVLTATTPPRTRGLKVARVVLILCWLLAVAAAALAAVWAWATLTDVTEDPTAPLALVLLTLVPGVYVAWTGLGVLIGLLAAGTGYYQAQHRYEREVAERLHGIAQAGDLYVSALQQQKRWMLMYSGVQQWGRLLAELLHRPIGVAPDPAEQVGAYAGLPAAVSIARPAGNTTGLDPTAVRSCAEAVTRRGWLWAEFEKLVAASPSNDQTLHGTHGHLPADMDLGLGGYGARAELVMVAEDPEPKQAAADRLLAKVDTLVAAGQVRLPPQTVQRLGEGCAGGEELVDRQFLAAYPDADLVSELFGPQALVGRLHEVAQALLCLPPSAPTPTLGKAHVRRCAPSVSVRVDVTQPMPAHALRMFEHHPGPQDWEPTAPIDGEDAFN